MSRIFKQGSLEQELFDGMQQAQDEAIVQEETSQERMILQAMEHLNNAAETFETSGSKVRASEVTELMTALAKGEKKSKSKKSSSKDEAKKVFMFFGFSPEDLKGLDGDAGDGGGDGE